jgi:sec-independent protein translocase protein TatB
MAMQPTIQFASLGMADSLILMVLALVVFGPRRLPQIGRQIGKLMYEFRKASNDFKFQMEEELRNAEDAERRQKEEERLRAMALAPPEETVAAEPIGTVETLVASPSAEEGSGSPSPYPGEGLYPEMAPEVASETTPDLTPNQASEVGPKPTPETTPAAAEAVTEESVPRVQSPTIQPPTVGEQVSANPPNAAAAAIEIPEQVETSPRTITVSPEGNAEPTVPDPEHVNQEHVNHNG